MKNKQEYIEALCRELELQRHYLDEKPIQTVYFGGGTPSQLGRKDFERIFDTLFTLFSFVETKDREITIEANPDDLSPDYIRQLRDLPFNRISIGIQSFHDNDLSFLNRRHRSAQAVEAVVSAQEAGFDNISIDLMYGLPGQNLPEWQENLKTALSLGVQHISSYHLIYEEGTKLFRLLQDNKVSESDEELSVELFSEMIRRFTDAGYIHYEISNFALPGYFSRHNSSYWDGSHYLGVGASAHSYNGQTRHWNVSSMQRYIRSVLQGQLPCESETIDERIAYNDYILTGLRTIRGIELNKIAEQFGQSKREYCIRQAERHLRNGTLQREGERLSLSKKGIFLSDGIMSDLMIAP